MPFSARTAFILATLMPLLAFPAEKPQGSKATDASDSKWLYAGEIQGIAFQLLITGACKEGSKVAVRLKGASDEDLVVSFRLNDADWRKTFTRELKTGREATVTFVPEDSQVCHPYVDLVEVSVAIPAEGPYRESAAAADASGAEVPAGLP